MTNEELKKLSNLLDLVKTRRAALREFTNAIEPNCSISEYNWGMFHAMQDEQRSLFRIIKAIELIKDCQD